MWSACTTCLRLCSLLTLATTKASDHKTTLMDYLASMVEKKDPEVLAFSDDLSLLGEARRYVYSDLKGEVARMSARHSALCAEADAEARDASGGGEVSAPAGGAAPPKPSNARTAALQEMLAKRAGVAPPPMQDSVGVAAGASGSRPPNRVDSEHPCTRTERVDFSSALRRQADSIAPNIQCLTASASAVGQWSVEVAKYFAEDPATCPPERVCGTLPQCTAHSERYHV
jgi:hypothetical protein